MKRLCDILESIFTESIFDDNFGIDSNAVTIKGVFNCHFDRIGYGDAKRFFWGPNQIERVYKFYNNRQLVKSFGYEELPKKDPLMFWKENFINGIEKNKMYIVGYRGYMKIPHFNIVIPLIKNGGNRTYFNIRTSNDSYVVAEHGGSSSKSYLNVDFAYKVPKEHAIEILKVFKSEDYISKLKYRN